MIDKIRIFKLTRYVSRLLTIQGNLASRPTDTVILDICPTNSGSSVCRYLFIIIGFINIPDCDCGCLDSNSAVNDNGNGNDDKYAVSDDDDDGNDNDDDDNNGEEEEEV